MGKDILRARFTSLKFLAVVCLWTLSGFSIASAATSSETTFSPEPYPFPAALAFLMFLAMSAIEGWLFWSAWKNRELEEETEPQILSQTPPPVTLARTPAPRKRTTKERIKVPV
jgi:hypothetical protein